MENTRSEKTRRVVLLLAPCILIITMVLSIGSAYGRYITALSGDNTVTVRPKDVAYVTQDEAWTTSQGVHKMSLSVTNVRDGDVVEKDMSARVRFFAPMDAGMLTVTLNADGKVYVGVGSALNEKTPMYAERGEGIVYKFFGENGEELSFFLEGEIETQYTMTVTASGTGGFDGFSVDVETTEAK